MSHVPRIVRAAVTVLATALVSTLLLFGSSSSASAKPVDEFGLYQAQVSCDPVAKPGVIATRRLMLRKFGGNDLGITRGCSVGGLSEHKEGRAWDWGLNAYKKSDRRIAKRGIRWLTETVHGEPAFRARRLGVMYVIWDRKMWRAYNPSAGWQPYTGASPHTDHVHISFTWNGAMKRTARWTKMVEPVDYGPCPQWRGELAEPWSAPNLSPCPKPLKRPSANAEGFYIAQEGETVERVAQWFNITTDQVRAWNGWSLVDPVQIPVGQKVRVTPPPGL